MRVYSKNIGISLVVAGLLLSGCSDKKDPLNLEENSSISIDENLSTDGNLTQEQNNTSPAESAETQEATGFDKTTTEHIQAPLPPSSATTLPTLSEDGANSSNTADTTPQETESAEISTAETSGQPATQDETATEATTTSDVENATQTSDSNANADQASDNGATTAESPERATQTKAMSVTGSVVDGIISGGRVSIYDLNKKLLGSGSTDSKGAYSIPIAKLPTQYKVTVEGGRDSGVDGVVNSNDKESAFAMSAIVDREEDGEQSIANVSPATTLVATMVEDGKIPLEDARDQVDEALGLESKTPLCKLDHTKNDRAYRAGLFMAMLLDSIATTDKSSLFKTLSKVVIEKKIKIKISNTGTTIEKLDLVDIATRAEISPNEIEKLSQVEPLIKQHIKSSIESVAVVAGISSEEQNQALAERAGWDSLIEMLQGSDIVDSDRVTMVVGRVVESMRSILSDQGLEASDPSSVALIAGMIDENLDRDISTLTPTLVKLSLKYSESIKRIESRGNRAQKKNIKKLIAKLYIRSSIDDIEQMHSMLASDEAIAELDDSAKAIEDKVAGDANSEELGDELLDAVASGVASRVEEGTIPTDDVTATPNAIKGFVDKVLADDGLYESIKTVVKVKIKIKTKAKKSRLTQSDKAELTASIKVKKSLKITIKSKDYTHIDSSASSDMLAYIRSMLESLSDDAYKEKSLALELALANLSQAFDSLKYETKVQESSKVIQKIKIKTTTNIIKTVTKIKVVIKEKFIKESDNSSNVLTDIDNTVGDYEVGDDTPTRVIRLPQPKIDSMGDIKKIKFVI